MGRAKGLRDSDVRALLRLTNELHELPGDRDGRLRFLMEGMCRLADARAAVFAEWRGGAPGGPRNSVGVSGIGLDDSDWRLAADYFRAGGPLDPSEDSIFARPGERVTARREDLLGERAWYGSVHYNEVRRPIGVDHHLYSLVRLATGRAYSIGLHRERREPPFGDRERLLVDVLHEAAQWLYVPAPAPQGDPVVEALSPRVRRVLGRLLAGDSEKQVARHLGLSGHTVHGYVKTLYRAMGVSSRGELLARWVTRG